MTKLVPTVVGEWWWLTSRSRTTEGATGNQASLSLTSESVEVAYLSGERDGQAWKIFAHLLNNLLTEIFDLTSFVLAAIIYSNSWWRRFVHDSVSYLGNFVFFRFADNLFQENKTLHLPRTFCTESLKSQRNWKVLMQHYHQANKSM